MIRKVKIAGFKSIHEQEIEFGAVNIIIGTNGAGKSNLLEALAIMACCSEGGIDYDRLSRRGARLSSPDIFRSAFKNRSRRNAFTLQAQVADFLYKVSINAVDGFKYHSESLRYKDVLLAGRSYNGATINGKSIEKLDSTRSILSAYRLFKSSEVDKSPLDILEKFAIYAPATPILRGVTTDNSKRSPLGIYGGRLAEALKEAASDENDIEELRRFFTLFDWFRSISYASKIDPRLVSDYIPVGKNVVSFKDGYMNSSFNDLYAYDVSEGALYVLFVLVLLTHKEGPKMFALDNVDSALNPGMVRKLMSHIVEISKRSQKQVFITTHNPSALDAIDLFDDSNRLFVASRDKTGQTIFNRIKPPPSMSKSQWEDAYGGLKLSEIWLSGSIGGLPEGF